MLRDNRRVRSEDQMFDAEVVNQGFVNHLFIRLVAKEKKFSKVDFKYSIFDACYLRNCSFEFCDFTGCRFVSTNLQGSTFSGCTFDYTIFEKTAIADDILESECPNRENLKAKFARTLKTNYQQLGEARSVNKAIAVELQATKTHLHKAWASKESYYRRKYKGLKQVAMFFEWLSFRLLDFLWGNGESVLKLVRSIALIFVAMTAYEVTKYRNAQEISSYWRALVEAPEVFLGTRVPQQYSHLYITAVLAMRLIIFGALISIILKRYNRR